MSKSGRLFRSREAKSPNPRRPARRRSCQQRMPHGAGSTRKSREKWLGGANRNGAPEAPSHYTENNGGRTDRRARAGLHWKRRDASASRKQRFAQTRQKTRGSHIDPFAFAVLCQTHMLSAGHEPTRWVPPSAANSPTKLSSVLQRASDESAFTRINSAALFARAPT